MNEKDKLSTGIHLIDHQYFFFSDSLNKFSDAMKNGEGKEEVIKILRFLDIHTQKYFTREEDFMRENSYLDIDLHVAQHDEFKKQYGKLRNDFMTKGYSIVVGLSVQRLMSEWLNQHVLKTDSILGDYICTVCADIAKLEN